MSNDEIKSLPTKELTGLVSRLIADKIDRELPAIIVTYKKKWDIE